MDELGPLNIEFLINNPEVLAQAKQVETTLQLVNDNVAASATKASNAITAKLKGMQAELLLLKQASADALKLDPAGYGVGAYNNQIKILEQSIAKLQSQSSVAKKALADIGTDAKRSIDGVSSSIGNLKNQIAQLTTLKELTPDVTKITAYNQKIQQAQAEINKLSNAGKVGFDELGNAVGKSTNYLTKGYSWIRQIAYALPGVGVAGIIGFAVGPIIEYLAKLDLFTGKTKLLIQQLRDQLAVQNALNDARLDAAKKSNDEIVSVTELYRATQNLKLSIQDRTNAAIELQNLYPTIFGNLSTEAILAGQGAAAYKSLKEEVLALAYAEAVKNKVSQLATRELDDALKITDLQREQTRLIKQKAEAAKEYKNAVTGGDETAAYAKNIQANQDLKKVLKEIGDLQHDQNLITVERTELEKRLDDIQAKRGTKVLTGGKNAIDEQGKNALESQKSILKADLDTQNGIFENEAKSYAVRKAALQKALADQLNIIQLSQRQDLLNTNISQSAKQQIIDKYNEERVKATTDYNNKIANLGKKASDKENNALETLLAAQISLQEKIKQFTAKGEEKSLSPDQQALTQISNQFSAITFQINQANRKYDEFVKKFGSGAVNAFNANPNNKVKLAKIDPATLSGAENAAIDNQANLNENTYIQQDIDKKKKLYADYEAYRLKVGDTLANKDYEDLLKSGKDFQTYLSNIQASIDNTDTSGPIQKRKEYIQKELDANLQAQKVALEKLKEQYASYEQQREALIESAQTKEAALTKAGDMQGAEQVQKDLQDRLGQLDEANFKTLDSYKSLYENIDRLTTSEAKKRLGQLYAIAAVEFALGKITVEAYAKIINGLDSTSKAVDAKLPEGLKAIGAELSQIGSEVGNFDEGLGKALNTVGSLITGIGSIQSNLNTIKDVNTGSLGSINAGLGLIGTAISIFRAVYSAFDTSKDRAAQLQYQNDLQIKSIQAINTELQRQLDLTKQLYGPDRISGYLKQLADIKVAEQENQNAINSKLALTGIASVDKSITSLNQGQKINARDQAIVDYYVKLGDSVSLSGQSIEDLQKLLDNGKLDAKTSALVQSLVALQQQAIDTQNALNADLTGTSFDSLTSDIVQMFQDGKTALNDFGDEFQKVMQTAILNSFKRDYLEKQLQGFYNDLAADVTAHGQLTKDDIAALQNEYNTILQNANTQFQAIQQATGVNLTTGSTTASANSLTGAIQGITADQADLLAGQFGGLRLTQLETNQIIVKTQAEVMLEMKNQTLVQMRIAVASERSADNSDEMKVSLKNIDKNTSSDVLTGILRAAGKN